MTMVNIMLGSGMVNFMLDARFQLFIGPTLRQLRATEEEVWSVV